MRDFIVDASIVAKWFVEEPDSGRARSLIDAKNFLRSPDLMIPQVTNVLWKRTIRGNTTTEEMESSIQILLNHVDVSVRLLPSRILVKMAAEIAATQNQTAYDSLYLAAAVQSRCRLITADTRFVRSIRRGVLKEYIISLDDPSLELN